MILYRIANCKYINSLDGMGARLYGGRWNSKGSAMIYTASSRALAVLEVLVHLPPLFTPDNFCIGTIEIPDTKIFALDINTLPANWKDVSSPAALKQMGNQFLKDGKYLAMKVPSSVVEQEYNYLLNPAHHLISKVKVKSQPFNFDDRLL